MTLKVESNSISTAFLIGGGSKNMSVAAPGNLSWELESLANLSLPDDMVFGEAQTISITVYSVLFLVSSVLNLNVLVNLLSARKSVGLSRLNTLLLQLVLADLSVTFLMMPLEIFWAATVSWEGGDVLCRICSFFRIFGLFLSSNIVICISIDRFLAILKPFSVRSSSSRINRMLFTAWFLAVILSLPQCLVFRLQYHPDYPWYGQCVTYGSFSSRRGEFLYFFMGMIFLYIMPLIVIIITYGGIVFHLHRKGITINKGNLTDDNPGQKMEEDVGSHYVNNNNGGSVPLRQSTPGMIGKAKLNTIKITLTLVGVFLTCWTPYYVICIWFWADPESYQTLDLRIRNFLFLFACTNSCANPLIYGIFSSKQGGIFASRERDLSSGGVEARRGWIGMHKVRLAGRRSTCLQEQPTATMSFTSRITKIHKIVSFANLAPITGPKEQSPKDLTPPQTIPSPPRKESKSDDPKAPLDSYSEGLQIVKKSDIFL